MADAVIVCLLVGCVLAMLAESMIEKPRMVEVGTIRTRTFEHNKRAMIGGLAVLDKELFISFLYHSLIEVYNSTTMEFKRVLDLEANLTGAIDMGFGIKTRSLYVMNWKSFTSSNDILRVDRNGKVIQVWSTERHYGPLSVTRGLDFLLSDLIDLKVYVLSPKQSKVKRKIEIQTVQNNGAISSCRPWHAIRLRNGEFAIGGTCNMANARAEHKVFITDRKGRVRKEYTIGSNSRTVYNPIYLAEYKNGSILVASNKNRGIILLDSNLENEVEVVGRRQLSGDPFRMYMDRKSGKLFVAMGYGGVVVAFKGT